jgi:hypothetical protein
MRVLEQSSVTELPDTLPSVLDVDATLRALAVNSWMANMDSYPGTGDNLYLYQDHMGRFRYIPWDLNQAFGNYHGSACTYFTDDLIELDPDSPTCGGSRPLIDKILAVSAFKQQYQNHLLQLIDGVLYPNTVKEKIEALREHIWDKAHDDMLKGFSNKDFEASFTQDVPPRNNPERVPGLIPFTQERDRVIRKILAIH